MEHEGGVVPDFCAQHTGCSMRKRTSTPTASTQASATRRIYEPSPVVRTVADARNNVLRTEAKSMLLGV